VSADQKEATATAVEEAAEAAEDKAKTAPQGDTELPKKKPAKSG
jgi:hypothetical protein